MSVRTATYHPPRSSAGLLWPLLLCVLLMGIAASAFAQPQPVLPQADVRILRNGEPVAGLTLEVADTLETRIHGLMFREYLAPRHGMLFLHPKPDNLHFWMKNTLIPLDMLFIDAKNRIVHIHHEAEPHSLKPIGTGQLVVSVIEINGGEANMLDIRIGDHISVEYPHHDRDENNKEPLL